MNSSTTPEAPPARLIYASFWGSLWQTDAAHEARAAAIAEALGAHCGRLGLGVFMQSSFVNNEGWYDGKLSPALSVAAVARMIQVAIDRGVAPEGDGRDDGSLAALVVFLDDSLTIESGEGAPPGAFRGYFETQLGGGAAYAVIPAGDGEGESAQAALSLVAAIWRDPSPDGGWAGLEGALGGDAVAEAGSDAGSRSARLAPLPSLYMAERVPLFHLRDQDIDGFLARLSAPHNLDELPGAGVVFRQAAALVQAKALDRQSRPKPATRIELQDFSQPNPRVTIAERLAAMKFKRGETHRDVVLTEELMGGISEAAFAKMRKAHLGSGAYGFVDVVFWTYWKAILARQLGLDGSAPLSIWDIGCGGGHFTRVCEHLGHRVVGTDIKHPVYAGIAAALGVKRTIDAVQPGKPTTDFGRKFDLVTAVQIEFDRVYPDSGPRYWTLEEWKSLFNDLIERQLNFPARLYLTLNYTDTGVFNLELMRFCEANGAKIEEKRGVIDWRIEAPIRL